MLKGLEHLSEQARLEAQHFQLAFCYCREERVRPVFGHDPNKRLEPAALTIFDVTNGFVMLMLVDSFGFSEIVSRSAGSGWKAFTIR